MTLSERINNDLKEAMKSKDSFRLSVIRMVKGAMQLAKPNPREELTDDDVITVISKQIKMRNDSIKEFEAAGRSDLVEQNKKEIEIFGLLMVLPKTKMCGFSEYFIVQPSWQFHIVFEEYSNTCKFHKHPYSGCSADI